MARMIWEAITPKFLEKLYDLHFASPSNGGHDSVKGGSR